MDIIKVYRWKIISEWAASHLKDENQENLIEFRQKRNSDENYEENEMTRKLSQKRSMHV